MEISAVLIKFELYSRVGSALFSIELNLNWELNEAYNSIEYMYIMRNANQPIRKQVIKQTRTSIILYV